VRRWVCIVTLLAGFTRTDYVWSARVARPTPIERMLTDYGPAPKRTGLPTTAWWIRS